MLLEYGPKCITILRYLSEAGKSIPLDAHTRIIRKLNVPQLLVALMEDGCGWIENDRYYLSGKVIRKINCPIFNLFQVAQKKRSVIAARNRNFAAFEAAFNLRRKEAAKSDKKR